MPQPGSNRVDVHTGSKQMGRGCVANRVRAHTFLCHGRQLRCRMSSVAFDQRMNPKSRERLAASVKE